MFEEYQDEGGNIRYKLISPASEFLEEWEAFWKNYQVDLTIIHPDKKPSLKPRKERTCRFCNKSMPEVTFKKDAHTIPQFAGNRHFVSDFECDTCNDLFSKYETQLTYFLGLSRTLSFLKGQEGIPKYRTPDKKLEVGENKTETKIYIHSEGLENNHWDIDEENKQMKIHSVKHPYVPVDCFKALLKMGLCYIKDEDLQNFKNSFDILQTNQHDSKLKGHPLFRLYIHLIGGMPIPIPVIFRMIRKDNPLNENCPKYCFVIYCGNYIFQFFLPGYFPDKEIFQTQGKVFMPGCPPFLGKEYVAQHGVPKRGIFDLSSNEKVANEKQVITMSFDSMEYRTGN